MLWWNVLLTFPTVFIFNAVTLFKKRNETCYKPVQKSEDIYIYIYIYIKLQLVLE
jgi:hypothetical protein